MTEDEWKDKQFSDHLEEQELGVGVCNICGEDMEDDNEYCQNCETSVVVITRGEYMRDEYENAECDKADANKELERER